MSSTKKNILLVGGSGYLGTHLRNVLSSHCVFSTSKTGKENSIQLDFLNKKTYQNIKLGNRYDCILILASTLQGLATTELKEEYISLDTKGLFDFLQFLSDNKLSDRIIYTSSMTVYGTNNALPVKEDGKLNPLSTYGLSKLLGEEIIDFYCRSNSTNGAVLRIPGIYGGTRTSGYIYNTIIKCIKNEPVLLNTSSLGYWETISIDDLCNYIKDFIENYDWTAKVDTFNISYGTKTDFIDCAYCIKKLLNSESTINVEGEKGYIDFYLDNSKIKKYIAIGEHYESSLENYIKKIHL